MSTVKIDLLSNSVMGHAI